MSEPSSQGPAGTREPPRVTSPEEDEALMLRRELLAQAALCQIERERRSKLDEGSMEIESGPEASDSVGVLGILGTEGRISSSVPADEEEFLLAEPAEAPRQPAPPETLASFTRAAPQLSSLSCMPGNPRPWYFPGQIEARPAATGAIPKTTLRRPRVPPPTTRSLANRLESLEAKESREAKEEIHRLVGREMSMDLSSSGEEPILATGGPAPRPHSTRRGRALPDGQEDGPRIMDAPFREETLPEPLQIRFLPVEGASDNAPLAWDLGVKELSTRTPTPRTGTNRSATPSQTRRMRGPRKLTVDDVESVLPRNRSPSPPGRPIRPGRPASTNSRSRNGSTGRFPALRIKLTGVRFGELNAIPTDTAVDPPPYTCFNCWGKDHILHHCPEPKQVFCNNCE